jgi:hypothetical protein
MRDFAFCEQKMRFRNKVPLKRAPLRSSKSMLCQDSPHLLAGLTARFTASETRPVSPGRNTRHESHCFRRHRVRKSPGGT